MRKEYELIRFKFEDQGRTLSAVQSQKNIQINQQIEALTSEMESLRIKCQTYEREI